MTISWGKDRKAKETRSSVQTHPAFVCTSACKFLSEHFRANSRVTKLLNFSIEKLCFHAASLLHTQEMRSTSWLSLSSPDHQDCFDASSFQYKVLREDKCNVQTQNYPFEKHQDDGILCAAGMLPVWAVKQACDRMLLLQLVAHEMRTTIFESHCRIKCIRCQTKIQCPLLPLSLVWFDCRYQDDQQSTEDNTNKHLVDYHELLRREFSRE